MAVKQLLLPLRHLIDEVSTTKGLRGRPKRLTKKAQRDLEKKAKQRIPTTAEPREDLIHVPGYTPNPYSKTRDPRNMFLDTEMEGMEVVRITMPPGRKSVFETPQNFQNRRIIKPEGLSNTIDILRPASQPTPKDPMQLQFGGQRAQQYAGVGKGGPLIDQVFHGSGLQRNDPIEAFKTKRAFNKEKEAAKKLQERASRAKTAEAERLDIPNVRQLKQWTPGRRPQRTPKVRGEEQVLDEGQLDELYELAETDPQSALQLKAMLSVMAKSSGRPGAFVSNIKFGDLTFHADGISIQHAPLSQTIKSPAISARIDGMEGEYLKEYLLRLRTQKELKPDDKIFTMADRTFRLKVSNLGDRIGLPGLTPTNLRRRGAHEFMIPLDETGKLKKVSETEYVTLPDLDQARHKLGHAQTKTTLLYAQDGLRKFANDFDAMYPGLRAKQRELYLNSPHYNPAGPNPKNFWFFNQDASLDTPQVFRNLDQSTAKGEGKLIAEASMPIAKIRGKAARLLMTDVHPADTLSSHRLPGFAGTTIDDIEHTQVQQWLDSHPEVTQAMEGMLDARLAAPTRPDMEVADELMAVYNRLIQPEQTMPQVTVRERTRSRIRQPPERLLEQGGAFDTYVKDLLLPADGRDLARIAGSMTPSERQGFIKAFAHEALLRTPTDLGKFNPGRAIELLQRLPDQQFQELSGLYVVQHRVISLQRRIVEGLYTQGLKNAQFNPQALARRTGSNPNLRNPAADPQGMAMRNPNLFSQAESNVKSMHSAIQEMFHTGQGSRGTVGFMQQLFQAATEGPVALGKVMNKQGIKIHLSKFTELTKALVLMLTSTGGLLTQQPPQGGQA
jgi:hypothetical protein